MANILAQKDRGYGFNAQTEEYGDMYKMGIIDPAKVVRSALQNAASVAGLLITTEAGVAEAPKKEGEGAGGMPDMANMDMSNAAEMMGKMNPDMMKAGMEMMKGMVRRDRAIRRHCRRNSVRNSAQFGAVL